MLRFIRKDNLLKNLEKISEDKINRVLVLKGFIKKQSGSEESLEILIFKGFSSSITHTTNSNLNNSILPKNATLCSAELFLGPIDPKNQKLIRGPEKPNVFLNPNSWD